MEIMYTRFIPLPFTRKLLIPISTKSRASMVSYFASVIDKLCDSFTTRKDNCEHASIKSGPARVSIILADDDKDDQEFFEEAVTEINAAICVQGVKDGFELMEVLNNKDNVLPDILFLDLNMPGKTGKECLEEIKNNNRLKDMPVVIYTTSALRKDISDTHSLGAHLYITKPNSFNAAISMIKKVFSLDMENQKPNRGMHNYILTADSQ